MTGAAQASEQKLIAEALGGDKRAYGELVSRYHQQVIGVVYRMCGDIYLAEEAAQEAFVRAWQRLERYNPERPFRNWLYRIAINAALDALRKQPPSLSLGDMPLAAQQSSPEVQLERKEQVEIVQRTVMALPEASRAVLVLREYQQLSYQDISEALGIPLGTVMSRLNYARSLLRKSLAAYIERD
jgi:RNA polymerase sigma-70 factor (ECF subfamily)